MRENFFSTTLVFGVFWFATLVYIGSAVELRVEAGSTLTNMRVRVFNDTRATLRLWDDKYMLRGYSQFSFLLKSETIDSPFLRAPAAWSRDSAQTRTIPPGHSTVFTFDLLDGSWVATQRIFEISGPLSVSARLDVLHSEESKAAKVLAGTVHSPLQRLRAVNVSQLWLRHAEEILKRQRAEAKTRD